MGHLGINLDPVIAHLWPDDLARCFRSDGVGRFDRHVAVDAFSAILCPMVFAMPQLSTWWQVRQRSEYAAAARSGWCTLWQVEQLMFGEDK